MYMKSISQFLSISLNKLSLKVFKYIYAAQRHPWALLVSGDALWWKSAAESDVNI